jgi:hypothetical protein
MKGTNLRTRTKNAEGILVPITGTNRGFFILLGGSRHNDEANCCFSHSDLLRLANATRPQADGSALESPTAITLEDGKRARLDFNIAF